MKLIELVGSQQYTIGYVTLVSNTIVPSAERLAKVAVIKESSMQYLVQLSDSEEENDGEDRPEYSKLVEKTLNLYYTDLRKDTLGTTNQI